MNEKQIDKDALIRQYQQEAEEMQQEITKLKAQLYDYISAYGLEF